MVGFKTPREAIEGMSLFSVNDENPLFSGLSLLSWFVVACVLCAAK